MPDVKIKFDQNQLKNLFGAELRKQIDFATAQTLTRAAFDARAAVQDMLRQKLKIKRTFLPNSVVVEKATKQNKTAIIGFADRQFKAPTSASVAAR